MGIGDNVRQARKALHLSQAELAKKANVSVDTVRKLEQGQSESSRRLDDIAQALGTTRLALEYGDLVGAQSTLERSTGDDLPTGQEEDIAWASASVGLTEAETQRLADVRRSIGPMTRAELFSSAESIMRNRPTGKANLLFNSAADRSQVDTVIDPEGDGAPRLTNTSRKNGKR